jgi:hypothetical protein
MAAESPTDRVREYPWILVRSGDHSPSHSAATALATRERAIDAVDIAAPDG